MDEKKLEKLRDQVKVFHDKWVSRGGQLTKYKCNHCSQLIDINQPTKKQLGGRKCGGSAMICTNCGDVNFVLTYPDGKTVSSDMNSRGIGEVESIYRKESNNARSNA